MASLELRSALNRCLACDHDEILHFATLCLGHVEAFYPKPMLELEGWAVRRSLHDLVYENTWRDNTDMNEKSESGNE